MAIAHIASTSAATPNTTSTTLTVNVPAGTLDGHVMVAFVASFGGANVPADETGWTTIGSTDGGASIKTYRRVASSEPASYTFDALADGIIAVISTYSGVDTLNPINVSGAFLGSATEVTNEDAPSITTTADGCRLIFVNATQSVVTHTAPSGYTQRQAPGAAANGFTAHFCDVAQVSAGATGTVVGTSSAAGWQQSGLLALTPAAPAQSTLLRPALVV